MKEQLFNINEDFARKLASEVTQRAIENVGSQKRLAEITQLTIPMVNRYLNKRCTPELLSFLKICSVCGHEVHLFSSRDIKDVTKKPKCHACSSSSL